MLRVSVYERQTYNLLSYYCTFSSGAEWKRMRKELDKQMLRPHSVSNYTQPFNDVTTEFIDHLRQHRREDGSVLELDEKLFRWSLEGAFKFDAM